MHAVRLECRRESPLRKGLSWFRLLWGMAWTLFSAVRFVLGAASFAYVGSRTSSRLGLLGASYGSNDCGSSADVVRGLVVRAKGADPCGPAPVAVLSRECLLR